MTENAPPYYFKFSSLQRHLRKIGQKLVNRQIQGVRDTSIKSRRYAIMTVSCVAGDSRSAAQHRCRYDLCILCGTPWDCHIYTSYWMF